MNDTIDGFRDWDAAYVLGALNADDRRAYERHLRTCAECTAAVAELAGLPGILGKLPADDAVALLTPASPTSPTLPIDDTHLLDRDHVPGLVQRLAVATLRRRRRIRFGMIGAAVAVVAVIAVGGIALTAPQASTAPAVAMSSLGQDVITASLQVTKKAWGTRFDWSCSYQGGGLYSDASTSYDLVVTDKAGVQTTVATWSAAGPHASGLSASSRIATSDIRSVEIRVTGTTTPLLREKL
ncbi:MAG TPA: zf-HC2 domain-containing protein [Galbitalea sp.]